MTRISEASRPIWRAFSVRPSSTTWSGACKTMHHAMAIFRSWPHQMLRTVAHGSHYLSICGRRLLKEMPKGRSSIMMRRGCAGRHLLKWDFDWFFAIRRDPPSGRTTSCFFSGRNDTVRVGVLWLRGHPDVLGNWELQINRGWGTAQISAFYVIIMMMVVLVMKSDGSEADGAHMAPNHETEFPKKKIWKRRRGGMSEIKEKVEKWRDKRKKDNWEDAVQLVAKKKREMKIFSM
jgi:hypothetical protein